MFFKSNEKILVLKNIQYICTNKPVKPFMKICINNKLLIFVIFLMTSITLRAYTNQESRPLLIISSYNPTAVSTQPNLTAFIEEFNRLGATTEVALENMNCESFSESPLWKQRMTDMLAKYTGKQSPSLVIILGQEAWATYLSLEDSIKVDVPVLVSLASSNIIPLPKLDEDPITYMPMAYDLKNSGLLKNAVIGGVFYEYDVKANIRLIRQFYPQTKHIALITDNTYGGVALQAHVRKELSAFPDLDLHLIDGRLNTIYSLFDELKSLPEHTALLLGTWRIDKNDGYLLSNVTYAMAQAVPNLPTFSLTALGLGYWGIGGIVPNYGLQGTKLAQQAYALLENSEKKNQIDVRFIDNVLNLDYEVVNKLSLKLPKNIGNIQWINKNPTFYETYKLQIWATIIIMFILLVGFAVSLYYYLRANNLMNKLRQSTRDLILAKEKAEESNRLKTAFVANVSHEIRTPLNAIIGFTDIVISNETSPEEQKVYFDVIKRNSDMLLKLINDILDISQLEAESLRFNKQTTDVVEFCKQLIDSYKATCNTDNQFDIQSNERSLMMEIDVSHFHQVLLNILSNADKFTEKGTIKLQIIADTYANEVKFIIKDTGCGIPLNMQTKVFERFVKVDEYKQGSGLGLSICQLTVEKWGGKIWVNPTYTSGTCIIFTHPL